MTRAGLLLVALLTTSMTPVLAQPAPFDMTPESDLIVAPPVSREPSAAPAAPPVAPVSLRTERFLLPAQSIRLAGEESSEGLVVYLTQEQAQAPARLQLSYLNAVVVAPEISRLAIKVNGIEVARQPISASAAPQPITIDLPPGMLRQGANRIEFSASQRHRTDCSINSTYELWTEIGGDAAMLTFDGAGLGQIRQLADLAAVGVDAQGRTTIRVLTPALGEADANRAAIYLAQQLALSLRVADLHIEQVTTLSETAEPGILDVVLGPAAQLPDALAEYRAQAASGAVAALLPRASGVSTLLVSGPDWSSITQASDAILAAAPQSEDRPRIDLPNAIPVMPGKSTLSLAELGVPTMEFNGRRYSAQFQFELPPDFYANNYGEAELVLDAAYSSDVRPGSEIDIFTNGEIASATPLLRTDGGILRNTVIRFPMTNLRPGRNEVDVVVNLNAQSDEVCSPGWTGEAPVRFVFSSSTQFRLPDYARAAELPNLQLLTGSGWPYAEDSEVPIVLGKGQDVAVTAMTLLARAAAGSNKVLPIDITSEAELDTTRNALLVMPLPEMAAPTRERVNLTSTSSTTSPQDGAGLDRFQTSGNQTNVLSGFADWALARVGLSLGELRLLPRTDPPYPVANGSIVLAQTHQRDGGIWTVLTGTDAPGMLAGMERLAVTEQWRQVNGRVSTLLPYEANVSSIRTVAPTLVQTQPFSPWNLRLVAANWFSSNILLFTVTLAGAAALLMGATALVLGRVGRQK